MTDIKELSIDLSEIDISKNDISKMIGYPEDNIPQMMELEMDAVLGELESKCNLHGGYRIIHDVSVESDYIMVSDTRFNTRKIITHGLKDSESMAILLCTAGPEITEWSKELFLKDDSVKGYIVDIAGSIIVDKATDILQDKIEKEAASNHLKITNRYSPGYCDWDIEEQHKLFSLLPPDFCNVKLNKQALMIPTKSISAIIGIGNRVTKKAYQCNICDKDDCILASDKTNE